jgi:hypothetical protein
MRLKTALLLFTSVFVFLYNTTYAQIETRLATNCATKNIEIPILLKNLENIKAFELQILFDSDVLRFDTSLYHNKDFQRTTNEDYEIKSRASNDTLYLNWSAYYGVNLEEGFLLSVVFEEIGSGDVELSWIEENCKYTNITNLVIPSSYSIDAVVNIPYDAAVEMSFEQFTIGCRDNSENGGCKAQAVVNITGGTPPYVYKWNDRLNQNDSIAIGLCEEPISVIITDAAGCYYADLFDAVIYPAINPEDVDGFEIEFSPDEVFITRPYVEFSIDPGSTIIEKYEWDFGDSLNTTSYTQFAEMAYQQVGNYEVSLRTENIDGCDTTIYARVEVQEVNFCIPNVFTPNGDGINDTWIFKLITSDGEVDDGSDNFKDTGLLPSEKCSGDDLIYADHFKSTQLAIYSRSGTKVFECNNCTEDWDGGNLPDGVYFYVFYWEGEYSNGTEQGNVTILGSSN